MEITPEQERQLHRLVEAFLEENANINLSAFRTPESCWTGNVLDSLSALDLEEVQRLPEGAQFLDIGTGGGFPLLPLAICLPQHSFTGLDATQKKIDAVGRIAATLGLRNIRLACGRTEELGRLEEFRDRFDCVTARGLAPLNVLLEYAAPFTRPKGHIVAWKSMTIDQELTESLLARAELSSHLVRRHAYELPADFGKRQLLVFEKTAKTPKKYPREIGVPKKQPLI
ncbi:MAG: 16S rRNA (guanine(527)-N(7))-methyltransferase RsmG [Candidatus Peribacteraceae bacterium]|nr:16S rRNA (guanine(527)-N(7))-methyltransferase RsmG [Candidatus Peribacteraceae bacterium]